MAREYSQEFINSILKKIKGTVPGYVYAALVQMARSSAGGQVNAKRCREKKAAITKWLEDNKEFSIFTKSEDIEIKITSEPEFKIALHGLCDFEVDGVICKKEESLLDLEKEDIIELKKDNRVLPHQIVKGSPICFIGTSPEPIEVVLDKQFVGKVKEFFQKKYLDPLKLSYDDVSLSNLIWESLDKKPVESDFYNWKKNTDHFLDVHESSIVVALGKTAKEKLGDRVDFVLPHPRVVVNKGDSGEVDRKIKQIKKLLDTQKKSNVILELENSSDLKNDSQPTADQISDNLEKVDKTVQIIKADNSKHIVYGAVFDPYDSNGARADAHEDWTSPKTIEEQAHDFLENSRIINLQHKYGATAIVVESSVEQYPNGEYIKAIEGKPHKVFEREFGTDVVHSGSWILGVRLGDDEWKMYEKGKINAFSPEGIGVKTPMKKEEMPKVEILKLGIVK